MAVDISSLEKRAKEDQHRGKGTILLFPERNAYLVIDCVPSIDENFRGKVTSHPVDSGSKISDHHIVENPVLKVEGIISDAGFLSFADRAALLVGRGNQPTTDTVVEDIFGEGSSVNFSKSARSFNQLATAILASQAVSVVFSHNTYNDCYFTNFKVTRNKDTEGAIRFDATFEQIQVAKVTTTTIASSTNTSEEVSEDSQSETDSGTVGTKKEQAETYLNSIAGSIPESLKGILSSFLGGGE